MVTAQDYRDLGRREATRHADGNASNPRSGYHLDHITGLYRGSKHLMMGSKFIRTCETESSLFTANFNRKIIISISHNSHEPLTCSRFLHTLNLDFKDAPPNCCGNLPYICRSPKGPGREPAVTEIWILLWQSRFYFHGPSLKTGILPGPRRLSQSGHPSRVPPGGFSILLFSPPQKARMVCLPALRKDPQTPGEPAQNIS